MAIMDRVHPDRRSGYWPRLLTDRRVFVQETVMHALFGLLLGLLAPQALRGFRGFLPVWAGAA